MDLITPWFPLVGPMLAAMVAVLGWFVAHRLSVSKELSTKRRELRIQYLIDAYRRLEGAAYRNEFEGRQDFESAVADIQLFGSGRQITLANELANSMAKTGFTTLEPLLKLLRQELRHELGMPRD